MRNSTTLPVILIVFGGAWLAHEAGWFYEWHALFAIALIVIGIAIPLTEGLNRHSVVAGPMLAYCGAAWLAMRYDRVSENVVWPLGVMLLGVLLLIARSSMLPPRGPRRRGRSESAGPPRPPL
jgi:hypothetical protein